MPDEEAPTAWLWRRLGELLGDDGAEQLKIEFNARMKAYQRRERLAAYRREIAELETRRDLAIDRDEGDAYVRRLDKRIAHRRKRLAEGWPDDAS